MPDFRLDCTEIVYRIIVRKDWLEEDGTLKAEAFLLMREADLQTGLSVRRALLCTPEDCKTKVGSGHGVDSLHVGHIGELGLDVWHFEPDDEDHAGITGLPPYYEKENWSLAEVEHAEALAGRLASQARPVLRARWRTR